MKEKPAPPDIPKQNQVQLEKMTYHFRSVLIKKYLESIENTNFIDRRPRKQVEKGHYLKR